MTTRKPNDAAFVPIHPPGGCPLVGQPFQDLSPSLCLSYKPLRLYPMFAPVNVSLLTILS